MQISRRALLGAGAAGAAVLAGCATGAQTQAPPQTASEQLAATLDRISTGRLLLNIVVGGSAQELAGDGIQVCALCPGFTYTEFHDVNGMRPHVSRLPRALWMTAEEVVRDGLAAVERGAAVYIPGRINRAIAAAARFLPRRLVRAAVATRERDFRQVE